jgi:hypothetical protein
MTGAPGMTWLKGAEILTFAPSGVLPTIWYVPAGKSSKNSSSGKSSSDGSSPSKNSSLRPSPARVSSI